MEKDFPFRFFHPDRVTTEWRGRLPHREQAGVCYFITFMTRDAFPRKAKEDWERRRRVWCWENGVDPTLSREEILVKLSESRKRRFLRILSGAYHRALDGGSGECVLARPECSEVVANALHFHDGKRYLLGDTVIMHNHVHVLLQPHEGQSLKNLLGSIRKYSAGEINRLLGRQGPFWAKEPFDHMVRSRRYFEHYRKYIRLNPVRAGLREGMYRLIEWDGP